METTDINMESNFYDGPDKGSERTEADAEVALHYALIELTKSTC